jgi:hypothetical protein
LEKKVERMEDEQSRVKNWIGGIGGLIIFVLVALHLGWMDKFRKKS